MSDKLVLADNSMSDNATTVERKCLTGYRDPDECPTKQQVRNSIYERNRHDELERDLEVRLADGFGNQGRDSAPPLPYSMNGRDAIELVCKVLATSPLTQNHKRHGIETVLTANNLLWKTNRCEQN